MLNVLGEKVYTLANGKHLVSNKIDLSGYAPGIYFVNIYDGANRYTKRIVTQ